MFSWSASMFRDHFCHFFDKGFFLFTASSFDHFNMNKWHGCASLRFELIAIVALWFYFTPKWERILGVVLERTHTLWSCYRIGHLRTGASPYLYASASTQWFIDILFITHDSRMPNKLCEKSFTV